jgi:hypothetical protein
LALFALTYKNRDEMFGTVYSGLTSCTLRFDHMLSGDPQTSLENTVCAASAKIRLIMKQNNE